MLTLAAVFLVLSPPAVRVRRPATYEPPDKQAAGSAAEYAVPEDAAAAGGGAHYANPEDLLPRGAAGRVASDYADADYAELPAATGSPE